MTLLSNPYPIRLAKLIGLCVLFLVCWIFFSDNLLALAFPDPEIVRWMGNIKDCLFILITTVLLYLLLNRLFRTISAQEQEIRDLDAGLERRVARRTQELEAEIAERRRVEAKLQLSEERHRLMAEHSPDVIWTLNFQGELTYISPSVEQVLGFTRDEYLRLPPTKTYSPAAWAAIQEGLAQGIARVQAGQPFTFLAELENRRKDGTTNWSDVKATAIYDDQGRFVEFFGVTRDITERKYNEQCLRASEERYRRLTIELEHEVESRTAVIQAAHAALSDSEERFRRLFEDTRQASVLYQDGVFTAANRAALKLLGMERSEQLVGQTPIEVSPAFQPDGRSSADKAPAVIGTAFAEGSSAFEWELARPDGTTFLVQALVTAIHQRDGDLLHVVFSDITAQKQAQERIEYLAYYDDLTGLPNRLMGQQRLQQALASARRQRTGLAVLYLDLDRFKLVNDTCGHAAGDQLLKGLAQRLGHHLRAKDNLCRLAADEFMLILSEVVVSQAVAELAGLCDRILASLAAPFDLDGRQIYTSLSIGVALHPQDGGDAETLMHNANTALFEAKRAGRQTYRLFETRMNEELTRFIQTRDVLREALARREFVLHYQPKLGLRSGRFYGVEALLRWRQPDVGLVSPDAFIDVAEESGLILPIGRWVLQEACRQAAHWRAAGWPDLVVAVNLSAAQFRQGQVVADIQVALDDSGLDPTGLELELTESILLQGEDELQKTLTDWKTQGIQLAIDDFGTGYSNLAYLKRFQVDKLKIDRSFIKDLITNEEDRAIVLAIIQIARSLNLRTVAEGVDERAMAEQLKVMGCDEAQGYLYAQPLPAEELEPWLRSIQPPRTRVEKKN